jgi:AraC-like DNA-binding protein
MNPEVLTSDLRRERIRFTSAEEQEEALQRYGVNQNTRQLGKGKYRFDLAVHSTDQADLFSGRFRTAVSITLEPAVDSVRFLFPVSATGQYLASGENVANDKLIVLPSGSGSDIVSSDRAGADAIAVPDSRYIEMVEALCPRIVRPERMTVIEGNTAQLHALRRAVLSIVTHPDFEPHDEQVCNVVAATIAWMGQFSSHRTPEGSLVNGARTRVAKLAQELIEDHYSEVVRIEDLCRATGVGVRTLQRCFREYFDVTISEYLKAVRLNAAYRSLNASHTDHSTVAAIALQHGFTHLGRFSVEFRERFGESPSAMLAARDGQKSHLNEIPDTTFVAASSSIH